MIDFWCSLGFVKRPYCVKKRHQQPFKIFLNPNPSTRYRLCFWNFSSGGVLLLISAIYPPAPAWRQTKARGSVAPGHGQGALWPNGTLVAARTRFFRFQAAHTIKITQPGLVSSRLPWCHQRKGSRGPRKDHLQGAMRPLRGSTNLLNIN